MQYSPLMLAPRGHFFALMQAGYSRFIGNTSKK